MTPHVDRTMLTAALRELRGTARRRSAPRIGWVASNTLDGRTPGFWALRPPVSMRIANIALWLNETSSLRNEMYRPGRHYDAVVFFKSMDERIRAEAERVKARGAKVVFDANVNYYEVWGEYDVPGTRPTEQQQADARAMTELADWTVADSSYLLSVLSRITDRGSCVPDNVDTRIFRGPRRHVSGRRLRLVWSGVAKKAQHLVLLRDVLAELDGIELVLVTDERPDVLAELERVVKCTVVRFSERRYARVLRGCDVIVSPKRLVNAYELAHTEYKITLGMAVGLPAVASPQQSYVEAISHDGGGIVAESHEEWRAALLRLMDTAVRAEIGARAARTVAERYSTPVVAAQYLEVISSLL